MGIPARVFVLFVGTIITAEYSTALESYKRDYRGGNRCVMVLNQCFNHLQHFMMEHADEHGRKLIQNAERGCSLFHDAKECAEPSIHGCPKRMVEEFDAMIAIGNFLCSDRGRSLLIEYQNSPCYTATANIAELEGANSYCMTKTAGRSGSQCEQARNTFECLVGVVEDQCGRAAAELAEGIFQSVASQVIGADCNFGHAHHAVKRLLGW